MAHTDTRRSRVLVAAAGLFFALLLLWLRMGWLQVIKHGEYAERADLNQEYRELLKPIRGQILDRHGRLLARDLQTYSVSAAPRQLEAPRVAARRLARVLRLNEYKLRRLLSSKRAFAWVARGVSPDIADQVEALGIRGVHMTRETRREYLLGDAGLEVLGRTNVDNAGVEGLELQFDDELRGSAGWRTRFRDGRGRLISLPTGPARDPIDGLHVVTTIDADLQSILETHLSQAVDSLRARRGWGIFIDPRTGEILAAANAPHLGPGEMRNWAFTDQYEPGSTYKIVVTGAALEEGVAKPDTYFEASENGYALVAPDAIFHDIHREAGYELRDAMRWSSNIVMGRLALQVGDERLYQYATALGFGSLTGVDFPGEAGGALRSPATWSLRSAPSIAIGYEISCTALQLALAYSAVANGGVLMRPQLVREIRDAQGRVVRHVRPTASHRVFGENTSRILREMLTAVVDSGTAGAARIPGLRVCGKTGTTRKYDSSVGGYRRGNYHSSFAGFAPAEQPVIAGVIVIDEPQGRYYGGDVAAPVFRKVLEDVCRLSDGLITTDPTRVAVRPPAPAPVTVPNVRMMHGDAARATLLDLDLQARIIGSGDRVLAQTPAPGDAVERGARVTLWLTVDADSAGRTMPDLRGLTAREALRLLSPQKVQARIRGSGIVVDQWPEPGELIPAKQPPVLRCEQGVVMAPVTRALGETGGGALQPVSLQRHSGP